MDNVAPEPDQTYLQLRKRLLNLNPVELGLAPSAEFPHVWGVMMETGYAVGDATLITLADGTASLYISTGGGILGSGKLAPIAKTSKALVSLAENQLGFSPATNENPLPQAGQVRFILLTYSGLFTAEAAEKSLASGKHSLAPLYQGAQETLDQLRLLSEKKHK